MNRLDNRSNDATWKLANGRKSQYQNGLIICKQVIDESRNSRGLLARKNGHRLVGLHARNWPQVHGEFVSSLMDSSLLERDEKGVDFGRQTRVTRKANGPKQTARMQMFSVDRPQCQCYADLLASAGCRANKRPIRENSRRE